MHVYINMDLKIKQSYLNNNNNLTILSYHNNKNITIVNIIITETDHWKKSILLDG